jgi:hypothetical protein
MFWFLTLIFAGISILFKISAIAIIIFLLLLSLVYSKGKERRFLVKSSIVAGIIPLVIFAVYGAYYDWEVFLNILKTNSNRFYGVGPEVVFTLINKSVVTKSFNDGWLLLGWISIFMVAYSEWKEKFFTTFIHSAIFSYLFVFIIFGSEPYGWYRYPIFPFLVLAMSSVIYRLYQKGRIYLFGTLIMLPIGTSLNRLIGVTDFQPFVTLFRILVVFTFFLFGLSLIVKDKKLLYFKRGFMLVVLIFTIWLSVKLIYFFYNIDNWYFAV